MICEICDHYIPDPPDDASMNERYADVVCPRCGQVYEYEEGFQIVLTQEQCKALKAHKNL